MMKLDFCRYIDSSTLAKLKTSMHKIIVVPIADTIKSKLGTIKRGLKKLKPFYLNINKRLIWGIIGIIWSIIIIFIGMFLSPIYQSSLLLKNVGNKEIINYKANVCLKEGLIKKVNPKYSGNLIKQNSPSCVEN